MFLREPGRKGFDTEISHHIKELGQSFPVWACVRTCAYLDRQKEREGNPGALYLCKFLFLDRMTMANHE